MPSFRDRAKPQRRQEHLIEVDLGDEVLLYDERTHHAHALNPTAAAVWRGLDGKRSTADLSKSVGGDLTAAQRERLVGLTLEDLSKRGLLDRPRPAVRPKGMTRRQILRGLAAAGAIAPVIATIETAHAGPLVSAMTCTTPGCSSASICPGTTCCFCVHTMENTNVCATPDCSGAACTASSQCPPGWVCFTNACCQMNANGNGAGGGAVGQCIPLCQNPQAPCPTAANTQKRSWMAR